MVAADGGLIVPARLGRGPAPPRVYAVHAGLAGPADGWPALFAHAAELGFDSVLIAGAFPLEDQAGGGRSDAVLRRMSAAARAAGLRLFVDLRLDAVAVGSPLALAHPECFAAAGDDPRDPRRAPAERGVLAAQWSDPSAAAVLRAHWRDHLDAWAAAGLDGVRCERADRVPAAVWRTLGESGLALLAWLPGAAPASVAGLVGAGFAGVFDSLAWWDGVADWYAHEAERLEAVAPRLATIGVPFETSVGDAARIAWRLRMAAGAAAGLLVPCGIEYGAARAWDARGDTPETLAGWRAAADGAVLEAVRESNRLLAALGGAGALRPLTAPGAPVLAWLRQGVETTVLASNPDAHGTATVTAASLLAGCGGVLEPVDGGPPLGLADRIALAPGATALFRLRQAPPIRLRVPGEDAARASAAAAIPRVAIEAVAPAVDGGRFAVKRVVGTEVEVTADVLCDGHDQLAAALLWRPADAGAWTEVRMELVGNDRWTARFPLERLGRHVFVVEAWFDTFGSFRHGLELKHAAGQTLTLELEEGRLLVAAAAARANGDAAALAAQLQRAGAQERLRLLLAPETAAIMAAADDRPHRARSAEIPVEADRRAAQFASWYEMFPRSQGPDARTHGTLRDVIGKLPRVRAMGFDVLYFTPIHPIGRANRKGRNNTLTPGPDDVGSPYAIGSEEGGHDALHPQLGTLDDFRALVAAAAAQGIELALDFAIQCSPDHPWLKQHPGWFAWRPDGSMKYAENPPKKYQDIVNVDFHGPDAVPDLWLALRDVVRFWAEQGVRLFRVDNPHTKAFPFWEWMIADIRATHPDTVFLAEAFTRPKIMYRLAKLGFGQSYTYFTWRNEKREIIEYMTELTTSAARDFFRPHFFVNTPDINPYFLQTSGRPGHLIRAALAATLASLWGVYQGFELCEATPLPGREEYLDSEKYELRAWPERSAGDIVDEITRLNAIRRGNPALHSHLGIAFHTATSDRMLWYRRSDSARNNVLLCAVSLDPQRAVEGEVEVPLWEWDLPDDGAIEVEELMRGGTTTWRGKTQRLRLTPDMPFAIWRARPARAA